MNTEVDNYLLNGCGRCHLYATPKCKVNTWRNELIELRRIVLECGLNEELKWKVPCYTIENKKKEKKNVLIIAAFNTNCVISFFNGNFLKDEKKLLEKPGENTQNAMVIRFTSIEKIFSQEDTIKSYILEAIELENSDKKSKPKEVTKTIYPEELLELFNENTSLKNAFERLTPGRQRAYLLFFSSPKQSKTRISRIEKYIEKILVGKGIND